MEQIKDKQLVKMDYEVLHFLPFKPSIRRTRGFFVERKYGNIILELTANWTLNTFDLITFSQILKQFQENTDSWEDSGEMGEGKYKRIVIKMQIDIEKMVRERELRNVKNVRKTITDSLERIATIRLKYTLPDKFIYTQYVYDFEIDDEHKKGIIYLNKNFIEFCIEHGLLFNYGRLVHYKKSYSVLLDAYLQGTKVKEKGNKNYSYRKTYKHEDLERILFLNEIKKRQNDKRKIIELAFKELHIRGGLPLYIYWKSQDKWVREDYFKKL